MPTLATAFHARPPARAAVLLNPKARSGSDAIASVREGCERAGLAVHAVHVLDEPTRIADRVRRTLDAGADAIVAGGGDGTIASVCAALAGSGTPLGVLPLGTANSFARSVGVPIELDAALRVIAAGHAVHADLGRISGRCFANSAAIGLAAEVADAGLDGLKRRFGRVGYLLGGLPRFLRHRSFRVRIVADGAEHRADALEILVANGRYHGGALVTWQAHVDSGELVARIVKGESPWALAHAWLRSSLGRPAGPDRAELVRFRRARIETEPPQPVGVDGEPVTTTPVDVEVLAAALAVYAPRDAG